MPILKVRQFALSDTQGELIFSVPIDNSGRTHHELGSVAQTFSGQVHKYPVECITIDSEGLNDVGFIKIDVEQHEREVLRGALNTIEKAGRLFRRGLSAEVSARSTRGILFCSAEQLLCLVSLCWAMASARHLSARASFRVCKLREEEQIYGQQFGVLPERASSRQVGAGERL